jgi:hypothetical protein
VIAGTQSRTARFLALAGTAVVFAISGAPTALADSTNRVAVCSSDKEQGVEVDNCVPNPNANVTSNVPGVIVGLEGGVGIGVGG